MKWRSAGRVRACRHHCFSVHCFEECYFSISLQGSLDQWWAPTGMSEKSKGGAGKGKADSSGRGTADARAGGMARAGIQKAQFQLAFLSASSGGTAQDTQLVDDGYTAGLRARGDSLSWQAGKQNIGKIVDGFLQWLKTRGSPSAGGAAAPPPRDAPAAHAASEVEDSDGDDMHEYDWNELESGEHAGGHGRAGVLATPKEIHPSASLYSVVV